MYTIKLMNEFLHGPIWIYDETGMIRRKYPLITEDELLMKLNEEARILYDECYSFNKDDEPCVFSEECYARNYPKLKELVGAIIERLNSINDGSFKVNNQIE